MMRFFYDYWNLESGIKVSMDGGPSTVTQTVPVPVWLLLERKVPRLLRVMAVGL